MDESLLSAIGLPNAPPVPRKPLTCRSALYFNANITGTMGDGDWLAEVRHCFLLFTVLVNVSTCHGPRLGSRV